VPDVREVDPFVLMSDPVARAPNLVPRLVGAKFRTLITKPYGGFADHKQLSLDGGHGFGIFANASKSMPSVNPSIMSMASRMSRRPSTGSRKGKHGLALCFCSDRLFQRLAIAQIDRHIENLRKPHFQTGLIE